MTHPNYAKISLGLIGVWFVFYLAASALHVFMIGRGVPPLPVALGIGTLLPLALFLIWFGLSAGFREFTMTLNPRILTFVQTWRTEGFVFLVLYTYGILPGFFAQPAGFGDITIGLTAPLVGLLLARPKFRRSFIFWQILGVLDLVAAVSLGAAVRLIDPHGATTNAMTVLPLSLIPTFAVPLFLILHFICIQQARRWKVEEIRKSGQPLEATGSIA